MLVMRYNKWLILNAALTYTRLIVLEYDIMHTSMAVMRYLGVLAYIHFIFLCIYSCMLQSNMCVLVIADSIYA